MQPTGSNSSRDRALVEAGAPQLLDTHYPVLAGRDLSGCGIDAFVSHAENKSSSLRRSPPG
jgi:hypothetical protein